MGAKQNIFLFSFATFLSVQLCWSDLAVIVPEPLIYAPEGASVLLKCEYTDSADLKFIGMRWDIKEDPVDPNSNVEGIVKYIVAQNKIEFDQKYEDKYEFQKPASLKINDVKSHHFGTYVCNIFGESLEQRLGYVALEKATPPDVKITTATEKKLKTVAETPFEINCTANGGVPKPAVKWLLETNGQVASGNISGASITEVTDGANLISTMRLILSREQTGITLRCQAENDATTRLGLSPIEDSAVVTVIHPPSKPVLEGYINGTWIKVTEELNIGCSVAELGNPLATLTLLKDGTQLLSESKKHLTVTEILEASHNGVTMTCKADNEASIISGLDLSESVSLKVAFGPMAKPKVVGNSPTVHGNSITLTCETQESVNPEPDFQWKLDDLELTANGSILYSVTEPNVTNGDHGGYTASHTLTLTKIPMSYNSKHVSCEVINPESKTSMKQTLNLNVLYGPADVQISNAPGDYLIEESNHNLTCTVGKIGNPAANLTWYQRENGILTTVAGPHQGDSLTYQMLNISRNSHGLQLFCQASNGIDDASDSENVTIQVAYGPTEVTITGEKRIIQGQNVTLTCEATESSPSSKIEWMDNHGVMDSSNHEEIVDGFIVKSNLSIELDANRQPHEFVCQATNSKSKLTVSSKKFIVNVAHPPEHPKLDLDEWSIAETNATVRCTIGSLGYPLGNLTLLLNDDEIPSQTKNSTYTEVTFLVQKDMYGKNVSCIASNGIGDPKIDQKMFHVAFNPKNITIIGDTSGVEETNIIVTCHAKDFSPTIEEFKWEHEQSLEIQILNATLTSSKNGLSLTQSVNITLKRIEFEKQFIQCMLVNSKTGLTMESEKLPIVTLFPPGASKWMMSEKKFLPTGKTTNLTCSIMNEVKGNPPANLTIKMGDSILKGPIPDVNQIQVSHTVSLDDENKTILCIVNQELLDMPIEDERTITVSEGPTAVSLTPSQVVGTESQEMNFTCDIKDIEPPEGATISWHHGDKIVNTQKLLKPIYSHGPVFGQSKVSSTYSFTPTHADNGKVVSCSALNKHNSKSASSNKITLDIYFAPIILCKKSQIGENVTIECQIDSNPKAEKDDVDIVFEGEESFVDKHNTNGGIAFNFKRSTDGQPRLRYSINVITATYNTSQPFDLNVTYVAPSVRATTDSPPDSALSMNEIIVIVVAAIIIAVLLVVTLVVLCRKKPRRHTFNKAGVINTGYEQPNNRSLETGFYRTKPSQSPDVVRAAHASSARPRDNLGFDADTERPMRDLGGGNPRPRDHGPGKVEPHVEMVHSKVPNTEPSAYFGTFHEGTPVQETHFPNGDIKLRRPVTPDLPDVTPLPLTSGSIPGSILTPIHKPNGSAFPKMPPEDDPTPPKDHNLNDKVHDVPGGDSRPDSEEKDGVVTWTAPVWL